MESGPLIAFWWSAPLRALLFQNSPTRVKKAASSRQKEGILMEPILMLTGIIGALLVLVGLEFAGSGLDGSFWNRLGTKMIRVGLIVIVGLILVIMIRHWLKI